MKPGETVRALRNDGTRGTVLVDAVVEVVGPGPVVGVRDTDTGKFRILHVGYVMRPVTSKEA